MCYCSVQLVAIVMLSNCGKRLLVSQQCLVEVRQDHVIPGWTAKPKQFQASMKPPEYDRLQASEGKATDKSSGNGRELRMTSEGDSLQTQSYLL